MMKFKKSSQIALGILSAAAMMSCSYDDSSENELTPGCTSNAQCAGRLDGKTQCDAVNGVCVAPDATPECALNGNCSGPNTAPDAEQECTSDAECANREDGKIYCQDNRCSSIGASLCNENQEWSAKYQTCVYPINSQADYEGYVTTWNTNGKAAFPGIGDEDPVFLLKTDDISLSEKAAWGTEANPFEAAFYGDNHTIALYGEREGQRLFGYTNSAEIRDVKINLIKNTTIYAYRDAHAFIARNVKHSHIQNIEVTGYWKISKESGYGLFDVVEDSELDNININIEMIASMDGSGCTLSPFLNKSARSVYRNISLNGSVLVSGYNSDYASLAFTTENDKWENCEINLDLAMGHPVYEEKPNNAYLMFQRMNGNTTVDRMNISKIGVDKTQYTSAMLVYDARSCTDCRISNFADNTNYNDTVKTYFIKYNHVAGSESSTDGAGLAMYNVLINSNYDKYSESKTPVKAANLLIQNRNEKEWNFGDASAYPYVYDKADIAANKVTVDLLNNNLKPEIVGDGSYLPWGQDSKGRFYLKFNESDGTNEPQDPSKCSDNQEWSDKYNTCVYPINSQADYEGYVTKWNTSGKAAFTGIGNEEPVFLLKTDDVRLEEKTGWGTPGDPFEAVFYGDNHTISLYGEREGQRLFGYTNYAEISDLKLNLIKNTNILAYRDADAFIARSAKHSRFNNIEVRGYWKIADKSGYGMFKEIEDSELNNININIEMIANMNGSTWTVSPLLNKSTNTVYRNLSLNGSVLVKGYNSDYAGLAFSTENDRWENCEINLDLALAKPTYNNVANHAFLAFENMKGKTTIDKMNVRKLDVTKAGKYTSVMFTSNTKACTDCVISNLQDNTNYDNPTRTFFIKDSNASGLSMYNVLINSNYYKNNDSDTPAKAINILIQNNALTKWDYANESRPYPYVYDKTDIAAGKVTVNLLNNNLKAGIVKSGSYLPWAQDNKGRFYLKFNAQDSEIRVIP